MPRSQVHRLGEMLGMYAYLAAMGGLRYWPTIRRASVEERALPVGPSPAQTLSEEPFIDTVPYEYDLRHEDSISTT